MKSTYTIFIIYLFCSCTIPSRSIIVCGRIKSPKPFTIGIYEPVNGYYNKNQFDTTKTNTYLVSTDSFYYRNNDINTSSFFYIDFYIDNEFSSRSVFLLTPGDSTNMQIDLGNLDNSWVSFSGDNSAGNNLFNKINSNPYEKLEPGIKLINRTVDYDANTFEKNLNLLIDSSAQPFKKLLVEKKVSKEYYEAMKKSFQLSFYDRVTSKLIHKNEISERLGFTKRDTIVEAIFKQLPITDPQIKPLFLSQLYFLNYFYYQAMKDKNYAWAGDLNKKPFMIPYKDSAIEVDKLLAHLPLIKDEQYKEDMWANYLATTFLYAKGYFNDSVITQFSLLFPNSTYLPYLKSLYAREITNTPVHKYDLLTPITIVDSMRQIKTISALTKDFFKGKNLYIDVWATWCQPCTAEFAFNKYIDSFLLASKIERVYISVDQKGYEKPWMDALNKFGLGGYHILAGNELNADLKRISGAKPDGPFAIPRYLIINRKGEIVNINAARPSDGNLLIEQLKKTL